MRLEQTLDELLELYGAYMIMSTPSNFTVSTQKALPDTVQKIAISINMDRPVTPITATSGRPISIAEVGPTSYTYEFPDSAREALRALLFLATEKERYNKFCKSIDNEITEELGSSEEQV